MTSYYRGRSASPTVSTAGDLCIRQDLLQTSSPPRRGRLPRRPVRNGSAWSAAVSRGKLEADAEDEQVKVEIFTKLDAIVERPDALLASNTSSIPIMKLGMTTSRPAPVLPLVELVPSLLPSDEVLGRSQKFVVNALLVPYILSAIRMFESGFASAEDIDSGMVHGCVHPMGPLRPRRPDRPRRRSRGSQAGPGILPVLIMDLPPHQSGHGGVPHRFVRSDGVTSCMITTE